MLAEEIWQIAEGFVEVSAINLRNVEECSKQAGAELCQSQLS